MNIFIAHWEPLTDRKNYLDSFFSNNSIHKPLYFCNFNRNKMTSNNIERYYSGFNPAYLEESFFYVKKGFPNFNFNISQWRQLTPAQICNFLNHFSIYEYIIENKIESALILEDDCILSLNFDNDIKEILLEKPEDCELLFLGGGGTGLTPQTYGSEILPNKKFYKIPTSRTVDAYWLTWRTAFCFYKYIFWKRHFQLPIDWEMNAIIPKENISTYHLFPYFIKQGSATKQYQTSAQ